MAIIRCLDDAEHRLEQVLAEFENMDMVTHRNVHIFPSMLYTLKSPLPKKKLDRKEIQFNIYRLESVALQVSECKGASKLQNDQLKYLQREMEKIAVKFGDLLR